jgi:predicted  nucleic acid-binding Zn-ribbon protein
MPGATRSEARAISPADVDRAADALLREGERPTIEKVRLKIGRGSPNTIYPLLDAWWSRLASRLDAGPAALHRLPEPVAQAAEALWLTALEEARRRAQLESGSTRKALARERQDLAVQAHVTSIREQELKDRLGEADRRSARLELEIETLTTLLRKEQASRTAADRRVAQLQNELQKALTLRNPRRIKVPAKRNAKLRKPATKAARAVGKTRRKVTNRQGKRR